MSKFLKAVSVLSAIILLHACKEKIDIEIPPGERRLVVEAEVTTETDSSYVKLTKTAAYYSNDPYEVIHDAVVSVNGTAFNHTTGGVYRAASPFTGIAGQVYNLNIVHEGTTYTSE